MVHQTGAIIYFAWGVLHLVAAYRVYKLGLRQAAGAVRGRLLQGAWNLAYFAIFVAVVAVVFNWNNSSLGYWLNLVTASVTDIGFILYILVPGYIPPRPGLLGPALWLLATLFSTLGILTAVA